jgi:heat shock protein HspQ
MTSAPKSPRMFQIIRRRTGEPVGHPDVDDLFGDFTDGRYPLQFQMN